MDNKSLMKATDFFRIAATRLVSKVSMGFLCAALSIFMAVTPAFADSFIEYPGYIYTPNDQEVGFNVEMPSGFYNISREDISIYSTVPNGSISLTRNYSSSNMTLRTDFGSGWTYSGKMTALATGAEGERVKISNGHERFQFARPSGPVTYNDDGIFVNKLGTRARLFYTYTSDVVGEPGLALKLSDNSIHYLSLIPNNTQIYRRTKTVYPNGIHVTYRYSSSGNLAMVYNTLGYGYIIDRYNSAAGSRITSVRTYDNFFAACDLTNLSCNNSYIDRSVYSYMQVATELGGYHFILTSATREGSQPDNNESEVYTYDSYKEIVNGYYHHLTGTLPRFYRLTSFSKGGLPAPYTNEYQAGSFPGTAYVVRQVPAKGGAVEIEYGGPANGTRPIRVYVDGVRLYTFEVDNLIGNLTLAGRDVLVQKKDANENLTTFHYDSKFRLHYTQLNGGRRRVLSYDTKNNVIVDQFVAADPSSTQAISSIASYSTNCMNAAGCFRPTQTTDPKGGVTSYMYDQVHGGVTSILRPSPSAGSARPEVRFKYVRKYPWHEMPNGDYVQSYSSMWVLDSEERCMTSAFNSSGSCESGASDKVTTTYLYGALEPKHEMLRGVVVTHGDDTRRTCYGYDRRGRRIFETKPAAELASCL